MRYSPAAFPIIFLILSSACGKEKETVVIENETRILPEQYVLHNAVVNLKKLSCDGPVAHNLFHGGHEVDHIALSIDFEGYEQSRSYNKLLEPMGMAPCPTEDRQTLDYVAASTQRKIKEAEEFYTRATQRTLPPVQIIVHPLQERFIDTRLNPLALAKFPVPDDLLGLPEGKNRVFVTDNASWEVTEFLEVRDFKISVYPQSQPRYEAGVSPMWDKSWVVEHEYGHHIFYEEFVGKLTGARLQLAHEAIAFSESGRPSTKVSSREIIHALSEGFSDLMGYYSSGVYDMHDVPCFEENRDPETPTFKDGTAKRLDEAMLSFIFFDQELPRKNLGALAPCSLFSKSSHNIGAVLTHVFDRLAGESIKAQGMILSQEDLRLQKTRMAIDWLQRLSSLFDDSKQGPLAFFIVLLEAKLDALYGDRTLTSNECQTLRELIPVLWSTDFMHSFQSHLEQCRAEVPE